MKKADRAIAIISLIRLASALVVATLISASLVFGGCANPIEGQNEYVADYDDARRATVDAWEEIVGPISHECYVASREVFVNEVSSADDYPNACKKVDVPNGMVLAGCYDYAKTKNGTVLHYIFILKNRPELAKADSAVHEYIHMLATCEYGNGDGFHSDVLLWQKYGPNTVEAQGCAGLRL